MARRSTGRRSLARSSPGHALTGIAQHLLLLFGKRRSSPGSPAWCVCRYASIETARSDGAGSAVARRSRYSAGRVTKAADLNGRRQPAEKPPRAPIGQRQLLIIGGGLGLVCLVDGIWIRQGPALHRRGRERCFGPGRSLCRRARRISKIIGRGPRAVWAWSIALGSTLALAIYECAAAAGRHHGIRGSLDWPSNGRGTSAGTGHDKRFADPGPRRARHPRLRQKNDGREVERGTRGDYLPRPRTCCDWRASYRHVKSSERKSCSRHPAGDF
jgi:hypothetical protein